MNYDWSPYHPMHLVFTERQNNVATYLNDIDLDPIMFHNFIHNKCLSAPSSPFNHTFSLITGEAEQRAIQS